MICAQHICVLGGCRAWNKHFALTGKDRVEECHACKDHRRWCKGAS